jgi:membrane protease YdiL (CAAX protease family)
MTGVIRRHPLAAFLTWFFIVGQGFAFVPVIAEARGVQLPSQPFIVAATLIGLLLPALVITRIADGPDGVRRIVRQTMQVRAALGWYLLALLAVPVGATGLAVLFLGPPADLSASALARALFSGLLLQLVLCLLPTNLWEEVAWTGFVQERLQRRHSAFVAAAITAPLFALQHVSLVVGNSVLVGVLLLTFLAVVALPFRCLNAWTFNRTSSLFLVGLLHAAADAVAPGSGFGGGMLSRLYPDNGVVGITHLLATAGIGLLVLAATRGRLGGQRPETSDVVGTPEVATLRRR